MKTKFIEFVVPAILTVVTGVGMLAVAAVLVAPYAKLAGLF